MVSTIIFWLAAAAVSLRISADGTLLERLRGGDAEAIGDLVARHHARLVGLAQTIVKNRAVAEDVAQETWVAVISHIKGFDGRSALSTWIIAILLNKAKTHARREGRFVPLVEERDFDADEPAVPASRFAADGHWADPPQAFDGLDPERIFSGRELWRHVGTFIEALPAAQKAVMILRDVEGRDAAETCELLDLSAANQRILLHRARAKVRNALESLLRDEAGAAA